MPSDLEDREHGEPDVVEGGDAAVGSDPLLEADGHVEVAGVGADGRGLLRPVVARVPALVLHDHAV